MGREEQMLNCDGTLSIMYRGLFADIENVKIVASYQEKMQFSCRI